MNNLKEKNIAIIGMACRFPGATDYREFWDNLVQGVNSIQEIPPERWDIDEYYSPIIDEPNKSISKWCGLLDHIDKFDNRFFSISPREAKQMDPQQRLLLEETWHCVEDSGVSLKTLQNKKTSVYVGVMGSDYHIDATAPDVVTDSYATLGNSDAILANRISYVFGFQGTSQSVNAACAASMVALHQAKISLLNGESDYAIAAGVNLNFQPWKYISFSKSRMLSPSGQCKTFDKDANGYVPGDGVGVLLLQPLEEARRAGNHIYGVIKGSAVNHGGQTLSITAPRVDAQRDVILAAYKDADISPNTVTYVEAHGTGTSLGDPIEAEALTRAFRQYTDECHYCEIGSVKTNMGHLEAAAGIAGVIKVLLMMQNKQIPPTLNIKTLNPVINFDESPFMVATKLKNWSGQTTGLPLRAGVSSFGFGGTNSHALIEYCSPTLLNPHISPIGEKFHPFILSAKSPTALKNTLNGWKNFVDNQEYSEYNITDIFATLMTGRVQLPYRYGCYVQNKEELTAFLLKDMPSIAKPDTHNWCLRVGELIWENFADVQPLLKQEPLVKKHLNTVQQCLSTLEISSEIKERFQGATWPPSLKPLYSFMVNYAYLSALIELGFAPSLLTGEKTGLWCALTLSGMMKLEDALAVLSTQKNLAQIELVRPLVPFYDPVTHQTRLPYRFDEDYLHFLVDDLSISTADVHYFVERALLLKDSQFTFKKYLEEWGLILRQRTSIDLDAMLYNDRLIQSVEEKYRKEQVLLMLIIKSSLRQLDKKWDLTRSKRVKEPKFQELLDLVIDGVMPKETVVELFMGGEIPDMNGIATRLNKRQDHLNASKPYPLLKKHSQNILVIKNLSQWFEKAMVSSPTVPAVPAIPHRQFLEFGQSNQASTPNSDIKIALIDKQDNAFQDTLLKLCLKGVDIKWDILYPDGTFNKVSLPTYGFERSAFWLTKADKAILTQPKRSREQHLLEEGAMRSEELINIPSQNDLALKANRATVTHRQNESVIAQKGEKGELNEKTKPLDLAPKADEMSRKVSNSSPKKKIILKNVTHQVKLETLKKGKPYEHNKVQLKSCYQVMEPENVTNNRESRQIMSTEMTKYISQQLREIIASKLFMTPDEVEGETKFTDLGIDSVLIVEMIKGINEVLGLSLRATLLYDYSTLNSLSEYLVAQYPLADKVAMPSISSEKPGWHSEVDIQDTQNQGTTQYKSERGHDRKPLSVEPSVPIDQGEMSKRIAQQLREIIASQLFMTPDEVDDDTKFTDLGIDSVLIVEVIKGINEVLGLSLRATLLYDYPSLNSLSEYIVAQYPLADKVAMPSISSEKPGWHSEVDIQDTPNQGTTQYKDEWVNDRKPLSAEPSVPIVQGEMSKRIAQQLREIIASQLFMTPDEVEGETKFTDLGIDSVLIVEMIKGINEVLGLSLRATLLYDYPNLDSLSQYIVTHYQDQIAQVGMQAIPLETPSLRLDKPNNPPFEENQIQDFSPSQKSSPFLSEKAESNLCDNSQDFAIIGMSGRFPGAQNLAQFWKILTEGKSTIGEIPTDRWSIDAYYDPDPNRLGKSYSKWGGFLEEFDQFDPLFFNISPAEAELMDPQQRLFLEECWKVLEDAGYSERTLDGINCGVYVGVMNNDYQEIIINSHQEDKSAQELTGNSNAILAARIAYILNLKGPAITIDTACSSSLVGIHLACQALNEAEADMMLVGGVTLYLTPTPYIRMSRAGMLSPDGKCKTFDNQADGFVPGEGVGCVLLKKLDKAIENGDQIYGVIKGSGINQDGRTNGITAPSKESQQALELQVYRKYSLNPDNISYVEAHGTGTKLGDPMEIEALTDAFSQFTDRKQYSAIGSVKTNIGHTSAAAGVASVIKVLLCLKHKQLVPSLNFQKENEHFNFQDSPFYVNTTLREWGKEENIQRQAAISSFGFSGTNCHVVLEEYAKSLTSSDLSRQTAQLVVLSAKNEDRLKAYAKEIRAFLDDELATAANFSMVNMAYTLQVGRSAMEERLVMVVYSLNEVRAKLTQYIQGQTSIENFYRGNIKTISAQSELLVEGRKSEEFVKNIINDRKLNKLALLWLSGVEIDWQLLYGNQKPQRISLPTYPFARERYWVPIAELPIQNGIKGHVAKLHPLLGSNTSTLTEQKFTTFLTGKEFYLTDHVVGSQKTLPGVAILEMARAAFELAGEKTVTRLTDIIWAKPITVSNMPRAIHISLYPDQERVEFEVSILDEKRRRQVHAQGKLTYGSHADSETVDIEAIQNRCFYIWDRAKCYKLFQATGLNYGHGFKTIQTLYRNDSEALSRLQLPSELKDHFNDFVLHPSLMDGALQTVIGLMGQTTTPYLPFALGEVELLGPLSSQCYAYARRANQAESAVKKFNISIVDETGEVRVRLKDFSVRALRKNAETAKTVYYQSVWKTSVLENQTESLKLAGTVLLFDTDDSSRYPIFKARLSSEVILVTPGERFQVLAPQTYSINPAHPADYRQLLDTLNQQHGLPSHIIHLWSQAPFVSDKAALNAQLEMSLFSIFRLSQALLEQKPLEPIQLLYVYLESKKAQQPQYAALSGFAKTIRLENPKLSYKTIAVPTLDKVMDIVLTEFQMNDGVEIRYDDNQRWVKRLQEFKETVAVDAETTPKLKENGVYLITGGAGGLGLIFAEYLAKQFKAKLVLSGRSELNEEKTDKIQSLNTLGAEVIYLQADVSKRDDVGTLIARTKSHFNEINGIIHSAGVIKDALVLKKTSEEMAAVLAPKVYGTVYLDEFTQNDPLDFFILFSSVAAVMGNMGQCDYAYANGFMDNFTAWRSEQRAAQKRFGKTLSINWPFWQDGGMQLDDFALAWLKQVMGLMPLSTETGILAFENSFHWPTPQMMIAEGFADQIKSVVNNAATVSYHKEMEKPHQIAFGEPEQAQLLKQTEQYLKEILSKETKLTTSAIQAHEPLEKYGIDSVMVMSLTRQLEKDFGELSKTLLFEYQTLQELAGYFIQHHQETLIEKFGLSKTRTTETDDFKVTEASEIENLTTRARFMAAPPILTKPDLISEEIAIIGVSGRYPQAKDLTAFWDNLTQGKDCITEVPPTRWDYNLYYDPDKKADKIYNKWGGFIDDVDKFDPLFFNMSPREAEITDPQERLFLETVWHTLEDAGYTKTQLWQKPVGVFVGVMWGEYQFFGVEETLKGHPIIIAPGSSYASIANRVSYSFNFTGPSLALDAMCSSSLTTIHLACESLKRGESQLAIAGGVNLSIHPQKYFHLSQRMFASSDGRCRSFGEGGDGYVPGEGVGAVLLKPLAQARADGDQIYAVIKGSSINHGGKTNGYTVPNPNAQAQLIATVLKQSQIDPRTISYVEAHGTGTPLGDPIEITGLTKGYQAETSDTQYCSIGSVKSNIGHLESAAGIASLTKVLLQMKYKQLVPSLHAERLNPNINLTGSPFYVQRTLTEWKSPIIKENGTEKRYPRRAAISAFGAGGANAHLIVEEYQPHVNKLESVDQQPLLILLSAQNADRLHVYINKVIDCLNPNLSMTDMAYTLQVGREAMEERVAMLVSSLDELREKLTQYIQGNTEIEKVYRGNVETHQTQSELLIEGEEGQYFVKSIIKRRKLSKLAQLWVAGIDIDWQLLYPNSKPQRISLPTYPFARERYWVSLTSPQEWASSGKMSSLHPLCDRIVPKLSLNQGVVFQKTLNKTDWIVKDHQVLHQPILPGVGYLEMAYVAATLVTENTRLKLTRVIWRQPLVVLDESKEVQIVIQENSEQLTYQIQSRDNTRILTHATGEIHPAPIVQEQRVSIEEIKARCVHHIEKETFYNRFQDSDIQYGAYFQGVSEVWGNAEEALSRIELPEALEHERQNYTLHPTLMDGALQTIAGIGTDLNTSKGQPRLPFSIEAVDILQPLSANSYAYVKANGSQRFQVAILDETGLVCIKCRDVSLRALPDPLEHLFYIPRWEQSVLTPLSTVKAGTSTVSQTILIVYPTASLGLEKALAACHHQDEIRFIQLGTINQQLAENHWEISTSDTLALQRCFESWEHLNIIYYLGGIQSQAIDIDDLEALEQSQERGVLSLFRLIKALSHQGLTQQPIQLNVITTDVFGITSQEVIQPFSAGLYGLSKVITNEYSQVTVRCLDLSLKEIKVNATQDELKALVAPLLLESDLKGEEVAFREGKRYVRNIEAIKLPAVRQQTPFKHQGVYLILGGAGGLGLELSLHLAKTVQARLILLGRRELSATQLKTLSQIDNQGGQVLYLRADATDLSSMQTAIEQAKSQFGQINGVIHSAIVLKDKTIENMDENTFQVSLAPKVQGSVVLHKVLQNEPLDFMMFFSSAQSFVGNAGQSNYAAGCTFKDGFAHALNQHHAYPVKIINWGYWGSVGVAATEEQRHRFAAQGILSIEPNEGMEAVTRILAHDVTQIMPLKAEAHVLENMGIVQPNFHSSHPEDDLEPGIFARENDDNVIIEPYSENRLPEPPAFAIKEPLENVQNRGADFVTTKPQNIPLPTSEQFSKQHWPEKTLDYVKSMFSKVLKIKKNKLDHKATFEKYGIDSVAVLDINKRFEQDFGQLPTTLLFEHKTIEQLTDYFLSEHQERLGQLFPLPADNLMTEDLFHPLPSSEERTETPSTPLPSVSVETLKKGEQEKEAPLSQQKASDEISDMMSQLSDADVDAIINSLLNK